MSKGRPTPKRRDSQPPRIGGGTSLMNAITNLPHYPTGKGANSQRAKEGTAAANDRMAVADAKRARRAERAW